MTLMTILTPTAPQAEAALQGLPPGFVEETGVSGGLDFPTTIAFTPGGKLFIALKSGIVRVWENGALLPTLSSTSARLCTTITTAGSSALLFIPSSLAAICVHVVHP